MAGRPLIGLPAGTGLRACVDDAFAALGLRPHVAFEAGRGGLAFAWRAEGTTSPAARTFVAHTRAALPAP